MQVLGRKQWILLWVFLVGADKTFVWKKEKRESIGYKICMCAYRMSVFCDTKGTAQLAEHAGGWSSALHKLGAGTATPPSLRTAQAERWGWAHDTARELWEHGRTLRYFQGLAIVNWKMLLPTKRVLGEGTVFQYNLVADYVYLTALEIESHREDFFCCQHLQDVGMSALDVPCLAKPKDWSRLKIM